MSLNGLAPEAILYWLLWDVCISGGAAIKGCWKSPIPLPVLLPVFVIPLYGMLTGVNGTGGC